MIENWDLIEEWMKKNLPSTVQVFNPPATLAEIQHAEQIFQCQFPENIKQLYLAHNGQDASHVILFQGRWLSIQEMLQLWHKLRDNCEQGLYDDYLPLPKECGLSIQPHFWHPLWIPVFYDGDQVILCIDLIPTSKKYLGKLILIHFECGPQNIVAKNLEIYLKDIIDSVMTKPFIYNPTLNRFVRLLKFQE